MSTRAAITISEAARAMHPGLAQAIDDAGGQSLRHGVVDVVADSEHREPRSGARRIIVARAKHPHVARQGGDSAVGFADADLRFAAAAIVALARGDLAALADPASVALEALAERVAVRGIAVLIEGATGTGKEVLARSIHAASPRRNAAFVAVNCAALPEAMLEALLFGHERGAFTGAGASAPGLFRAADGGTLLLDEIAELPLGLQAKLLRALQEGEVLPIGATCPVKVDVRVIAAANRDLAGEVAAGRFRADLFYRIAVFPLATTPLAHRRADIVPIAAALWLRQGTTAWPTAAALARLEAHDWPGNVRELGNVLARAAVITEGERIEARDIVFDAAAVPPVAASLGGAIREREFDVISATLEPEPVIDVEAIADDAYRAGFAAGVAQAEAAFQPERALLSTATAALIAASIIDPDAVRPVFLNLVKALAEAAVAAELIVNPEVTHRSAPLSPAPTPPRPADFAIETPSLGAVGAEVTRRDHPAGDVLHVHFAVDRSGTAALIAGASDGLERAVVATGNRLDAVTIEVRGGTASAAGSGSDGASGAGHRGGDAPQHRPAAPPQPETPSMRVRAPVIKPVVRDRFA